MYSVNKLSVLLWLCVVYYAKCEGFSAAAGLKGNTKHEEKDRKSKQHDNVEFPYKLENAPIPSIHDGPKATRLYTKSIALELLHERSKRDMTSSRSLYTPNPQKPRERNEVVYDFNENGNDASKLFHHPGRSSEPRRSYPINSYNYYNTIKTYGSAFQYGSNQPFKGYVQTANIGVIPPRDVDTKSYYNSISGLNDYPLIKQHSNSFLQSLYENQQYPNYGYGYAYDSRDSVKNAYRNVLTGLAMWSIQNGLVNSTRYTVYNYTTLPRDYPSDITLSNDTIIPCIEDTTALCNEHTQPLCINNGTTFCVSSAMVPCQNVTIESACVDIPIPCDGCENAQTTHLPCAANITIFTTVYDEEKAGLSHDSSTRNVVFCATTLVVPQVKNIACDKLSCLESTTENNLESIMEDTADFEK